MSNSLLVLFVIAFGVACGNCQQSKTGAHADPIAVNLCEVLKSPAAFVGKPIIVNVRITSMKEGSSIWSPDCPKLGVALVTTLDGGPESGVPDLRRELAQYQRASRPVLATLTGFYVPDYFDEIRRRSYAVFKASAANAVRRSSSKESR